MIIASSLLRLLWYAVSGDDPLYRWLTDRDQTRSGSFFLINIKGSFVFDSFRGSSGDDFQICLMT